MSTDLFTLEGRRFVCELLSKEEQLSPCAHGFLDHAEGIPVTDEGMLKILKRRHTDLLDRVEVILGLSIGEYEFREHSLAMQMAACGAPAAMLNELRQTRVKEGRPLDSRITVVESPAHAPV